jgi:hypothetical protein
MSSARQPPRPSRERSQSQRTPSRWYGRSAVRSASPGSAAQLGEGLREPRPGPNARPLAVRLGFALPIREIGARDEPHRLDEREPLAGAPLRRLPAAEHLVELLPVHLDPATLEEHEPLGPLPQLPELRLGDLLLAEREADGEVEHRVEAEACGLALSHRDRHARSRGPAAAPPVGHPDDDAALLERGHLAEEAVRLGRRPRLRLEEPPRVGERLHERALLRGPVHGLE